jgi:hypothetical protein
MQLFHDCDKQIDVKAVRLSLLVDKLEWRKIPIAGIHYYLVVVLNNSRIIGSCAYLYPSAQ